MKNKMMMKKKEMMKGMPPKGMMEKYPAKKMGKGKKKGKK